MLGGIGMSKKERLGLTAIIVSVCCMVVGIIIGIVARVAVMKMLGRQGFPGLPG